MSKSFILIIETTTDICSVALAQVSETKITASETKITATAEATNAHASNLTLLIAEVLQKQGIMAQQLYAVAVSDGPGSYTGLRIGAATAKGICYASGAHLIAADTLRGIAEMEKNRFDYSDKKTLFCPMIDARRMEVYTAIYDLNGVALTPIQAVIIDTDFENVFLRSHNIEGYDQIVFCGNGAEKCTEILKINAHFLVRPSVSTAAGLLPDILQKIDNQKFVDIAYYEPNYLKGANITKSVT